MVTKRTSLGGRAGPGAAPRRRTASQSPAAIRIGWGGSGPLGPRLIRLAVRFTVHSHVVTVRRLMIEARLRVIYGDTDQMGVVYYANYFRYFGFSLIEYFRGLHRSYRDLELEGSFLPVVEATCHYRSPARYDDLLVIPAELKLLRRTSLLFALLV